MRYPSVSCLPECDERHDEDCPREKAEYEYYRWYFGQDRGTKAQKRRILLAMDPRPPQR